MLIATMMPQLLQGQLRNKFYLYMRMMSGTYHRGGTTFPSPHKHSNALFLTGNIFFFIYLSRKQEECKRRNLRCWCTPRISYRIFMIFGRKLLFFCLFVFWVCLFQKRWYVPEFVNKHNSLIQNIPLPKMFNAFFSSKYCLF